MTVRKIANLQDTPEKLLAEWLHWWRTDDRVPAKLPRGLHVRTAVALLYANPEPDRHPEGVQYMPGLRDRVVVAVANGVLGLASEHYRMRLRGAILYGLRAAVENTEAHQLS